MTGTARIFVSIVMEWKDPRLAWEINEENCADYINVYTGYDQGTYNKVVAAVVVVKNRNETNYKKKIPKKASSSHFDYVPVLIIYLS